VPADSRTPAAAAQLRLALGREPRFDRESFIIAASNREAAAAVDAWPDWPGGALALVGPAGSGKTHLGRAWAARAGARSASAEGLDLAGLPAGPVLVEDADRGPADAALFHLLNRAQAPGGLLLTARTPPRAWSAALPDLRSRLNAVRVVTLGAPDDGVLEGVLRRLFRDRNIRPDPELIAYLVRRIERSIPAAEAIVARLDEAADASRRGINRALAREILGTLDGAADAAD